MSSKNKIKILHISPTYFPAFRHGGPILSVHALNKWLVKKGAEVTVFATDINGKGMIDVPLNQEVNVDGVKVWYFPASWRRWEYSCGLHKALKDRAKDFDLIHITSVFLSASALGAYYAKKYGKPYVISPRGSLMNEPLQMRKSLIKKIYLELIEKRNLSGASAIHFTAEKEKEEYLDTGLDYKSFFVVPNALDPAELDKYKETSFRKKFGISKDKKIILSLGRINWKKGFDTLIPAFAEILKEDPRCFLVIAGESDQGYKKEVEKLIRKCGVGEKVLFAGMLLREDKAGAFKESDVFVLPTYSENFGMSVVEAMHCGLPTVVSEGLGIGLDIAQNEAGIVVKKETGEFADAILSLLKNKQLSSKIGKNGRKFVKDKFSPDILAEEFIRQYEKLINLYKVL
jgi:glycosyltransferase involved in cell wall biosynthesis